MLDEDLSQTCLLAPGSSLASGSITPNFTWHSLHVQVCLQISHFYKDTRHIDSGPMALQHELILTKYNCNDPILMKDHSLRYWWLKFQHVNLKRCTIQYKTAYTFCLFRHLSFLLITINSILNHITQKLKWWLLVYLGTYLLWDSGQSTFFLWSQGLYIWAIIAPTPLGCMRNKKS